ncbi:hypothetical protein EJ07DRAFT_100385 [Lizonia empirigonia]|nr:hypothetical protein EJ07DRAFT_100385 [Lizonia empirigonia]
MQCSLPLILIGHDRGARIAHHLHLAHLTTPPPSFHITSLALLDIIPTLSQWSTGASTASATAWFHWAGSNAPGRAKMAADDAMAVYAAFFDRNEVVLATTRDYEAGAMLDLEFEAAAVERGYAIRVPLLLVYSKEFLPKRARLPVREVWSWPWSAGGDLLAECAIGDGVEHFVPEEAPEETAKVLGEWLVRL